METSGSHAVTGLRSLRWWQALGTAVAIAGGLGLLALAVLAWWPASAFSRWASTQLVVAQGIAFPTVAGLAVLVSSALVLAAALRGWTRQRGVVARWFAIAALPGWWQDSVCWPSRPGPLGPGPRRLPAPRRATAPRQRSHRR